MRDRKQEAVRCKFCTNNNKKEKTITKENKKKLSTQCRTAVSDWRYSPIDPKNEAVPSAFPRNRRWKTSFHRHIRRRSFCSAFFFLTVYYKGPRRVCWQPWHCNAIRPNHATEYTKRTKSLCEFRSMKILSVSTHIPSFCRVSTIR